MLVRELKRLGAVLIPLFFFTFLGLKYYGGGTASDAWSSWDAVQGKHPAPASTIKPSQPPPKSPIDGSSANIAETHRQLYSVSTPDRKHFHIKFGQEEAVNPNIIPHPTMNDTWIIVGQHQRSDVKNTVWFAEVVCNAVFKNGALECLKAPLLLPIANTPPGKCTGEFAWFNFSVGPHDARVFYGPRNPYAMYGSNSEHTCFGQWMLDFRLLVDWGFEAYHEAGFRAATELQKPVPQGGGSAKYGLVEKNWFVFWDRSEQMYIHTDIVPKRSFAKLELDGSAGQDLAPLAAAGDEKCLASYVPKIPPENESIHQATNSLSITLCERSDPSCKPNDQNTFVFTIFQHKTFYNWHGRYEPYVMVFRQIAPFEVYGISGKPLWVSGRGERASDRKIDRIPEFAKPRPNNETEMVFMTSMSWKAQGQKYHGYIDDILFLAYGIEDLLTYGIDVVAGDLFKDLRLCSDVR